MWYVIFITLSISIFLLFMEQNLSLIFSFMKNKLGKGTELVDRTIESRRKNLLTIFLSETERRIQSSNLRLYIPYNTFTHLLLSICMAIITFSFVQNKLNTLISVVFSVIGFMIPYVLLQLITDNTNVRIKRYSVDFLIILKNYFKVNGDIFRAFEEGKNYFVQPLRTYVDIAVYEYKNKIRATQVLDNLSNKLPTKELSSFILNLKISYMYGGNIEGLIDEFIGDISGINDDSDKEDLEDKMLNKGLYVLLAINFFYIYYMLNSEYKEYLVSTLWGNIVITIDLMVSIYVIYNILKKEV